MSEEIEIESVNKHYLEKVMDLAEEADVEATEDIFDARGMKLIAKGAKISRGQQEKLILHKLRKPLESSITVAGGVDTNLVVTEAARIADTSEPVGCILKEARGGMSPLNILAQIKLGKAMSMMLTIVERGGASALEHCVMVSLIAICLAKKRGLNDKDQQVVALAGLMHDIGELYIEPEFLRPNRRLLPHEWRYVVVHPRIGQMLISELENYPPEVALAVAEHHERFDGSGYPRQLAGNNISAAGQALAVAEMIASLSKRDQPLERAELALRIIPGEQSHDLVSAISSVLRKGGRHEAAAPEDAAPSGDVCAAPHGLFERISSVLQMGHDLLEQPAGKSQKAKELLLRALERAKTIQRAYSSTGLDVCLTAGNAFVEDRNRQIMFEVAVATAEIKWRLREMARDLALHSTGLDAAEAEIFEPLIVLLDEGR